jgi:ABC-type nitrate/sulfonate/bicarbonate transport system permease component
VVSWRGRIVVLLGVLMLWQLTAMIAVNPYFPPPARIAEAVGQLWPSAHLADDILPSLVRVLVGWAAASALGITVGVALGRSRAVADYVEFVFTFLRTVPPPLLVPVFMLVFGISTQMEVATIMFGTVWPVLLNAVDGARSVDPVLADTAQVFRIRHLRWVAGVVLPAAGPKIFAGLRVSLSIALILMVISEMVGATSGIGYQLGTAQGAADLPGMWAWIVLTGLLGYLLNRGLLAVEHKALARSQS